MGQERKITEIFGKCYRLMHRVGAAMGDQFFADLWSRESDSLLSDFIVFLKVKGETLVQTAAQMLYSKVPEEPIAESNSGKTIYSKDFVRDELARWQNRVAQYQRLLSKRTQKVLELLEIVKHVGQTNAATPLLLERELLKLRLVILDSISSPKQLKNQKDRRVAESPKQSPVAKESKLSAVHKEILNFIKSRGDQIQNTEIFARFGNIHRRTIKRKLSDLVLAGSLARSAKGKRVFYAVLLSNG